MAEPSQSNPTTPRPINDPIASPDPAPTAAPGPRPGARARAGARKDPGAASAPASANPPAAAPPPDLVKSAPATNPPVQVEPVLSTVQAQFKNVLPPAPAAPALSADTTVIILTILDGLASMLFGSDAAMNAMERDMLKEPMQRILSRLNFAQSAALAQWTDPILLVMGFIAWGSRISRQQQAKRPPPGNPPPSNGTPTLTPAPPNGHRIQPEPAPNEGVTPVSDAIRAGFQGPQMESRRQ